MERTVPQTGNDAIELYIRTYYSLLRSTREVQIKTLLEAHRRINSALHVKAPCDVKAIRRLTQDFGIRIIEDASHAVGAEIALWHSCMAIP